MNELINITTTTINNEEVNAVNARELHEKLEVKTQFKDWMPRRIEEFGFEEGRDFTVLKNEHGRNVSGKFSSKEYIISLDMAKELAMVENNEQGRRIRRYFIEVEKNARKFSEAVAAQVSAMIPVIRENERLRFQLDFARHFLPQGKPGELNEQGVPKTQFRRGYYTSGKGKSITALIERAEQPGLFDEIELRQIGNAI
ncbi:antA/AntB antirepressor family protein [uncultured Victivallis sp.]|uniref:antA/AntB antirepressor family protein n=1 Tax=uncultured Victivallis sp. TaxID=354118 RepID=UPI00258AB2D8|nr:antA/AntB antirepressor family protein [uncultured Victivallis sp.]